MIFLVPRLFSVKYDETTGNFECSRFLGKETLGMREIIFTVLCMSDIKNSVYVRAKGELINMIFDVMSALNGLMHG